jgi:hypothetical protein
MQYDGTRTRSYLIWLCVSFLIIDNVLALASPKPDTGTRLNSIPFVPGLNAQSHPEGARAEVSTELASKFIKKNSVVSPNSSGANATVSSKEVRVVYLVPSDRTIRQDYVSGIQSAIAHLQAFYQGQLGSGFAFSLHTPIVEVFQTSHAASFYSTGNNATQIGFWTSVLGDGFALSGGGFNDPNNRWIYYVDADPTCGQVTGGTSGVALLPANDLRGLTGQSNVPPCVGQPPDLNGPCRWVGGLGHELGHAFGLPHPPGCDQGTCSEFAAHSLMYLGYIDYPNTYFLDDDKSALLATGFFSVLSPLQSTDCSVPTCRPSLSVVSHHFDQRGGEAGVDVLAPANCPDASWEATSNDSWITITSEAGGSGPGRVTFVVRDNPGPARQGSLTIAGQQFNVTQAGTPVANCTYSITPLFNNFEGSGGTGAINVTAGQGCSWQAISNASWVTITSGGAGVGNGTVSYTVAANTGPPRKAVIIVAGKSFSIKQIRQ